MAGGNRPGPLGGAGNHPLIDAGTSALRATYLPGPIGAPGTLAFAGAGPSVLAAPPSAIAPVSIAGPILVGKAKREPGYNFDGTAAEDMMYADAPSQSSSIRSDPVFTYTDGTLEAYMKQLMESLSVGDMETVALEMHERFCRGVGGTYTSPLLDAEIKNHETTLAYHDAFLAQLVGALAKAHYDFTVFKPLSMGLLNFSSFWDKATGLGITIHQVWSVKAELYNFGISCGTWWGDLWYTFYDHFGLDWADIEKHGEDHIPQYYTGDFFKAWYILQHYRSAKPFITEFTRGFYVARAL